MKIFKCLSFPTAIFCCIFAMVVTSCDKNNDNQPSLSFSPSKTEVAPGGVATVTINGGTAPFTVNSSDAKTATATVDKNIITITGVKIGTATILVSDKDKLAGAFEVDVKEKSLSFDKNAVTIDAGKEDVVTIKDGSEPYTIAIKDSNIATASIKDKKVTIKGVKAGTTTITLTDKDKISGTISVTVK